LASDLTDRAPQLRRRLRRALLLAVIAAALGPLQVLAAAPTRFGGVAVTVQPGVRTIDVNLYRPGAVAYQFTGYWCVPANAETMLNIINATTDRSQYTQGRYAWHIHRLNRYTYATNGNDVTGWARFLDQWLPGDKHYLDRSYDSRGAAIGAIVESIDRTGDPVGIVVDRGTHAWTVLGYRATIKRGSATPTIEGLYVSGSLLNTDPRPYRFMSLADFAGRFTPYHEWQRAVIWEGKFVIVAE
jgi:hypothetical protein